MALRDVAGRHWGLLWSQGVWPEGSRQDGLGGRVAADGDRG